MGKPFLIITGPQATGKSAHACRAFQNAFAYETAAANLQFFKRLLKTQWKDDGLRYPKRIKIVDRSGVYQTKKSDPYVYPDASVLEIVKSETTVEGSNGEPVRVSIPQYTELLTTVNTLIAATKKALAEGTPLPYDNFILDEANEFFRRIEEETPPGTGYDTYKPITNVIMDLASKFRQLTTIGVGVCLVMHDRDYDPETGKVGGPEANTRGIAKKLVQASDGAIQRMIVNVKDAEGKPVLLANGLPKTKAIWAALRDETWDRKLRGLLPEDGEVIADLDLKTILTDYCDFDM